MSLEKQTVLENCQQQEQEDVKRGTSNLNGCLLPSSSAEKGFTPVDVFDVATVENLDEVIEKAFHQTRRPIILRGYDIGPCRERWTPEYLVNCCPEGKKVKVHKSKEERLDFRRKNFVYDTISFRHMIKLCSGIREESIEEENYNYFWYLRSIGEDPRGRDVSDISVHFPELAKDLSVPPLFPKESFFSSVFRITSPKLQLWTHYDTCDNILIQIRGKKRIVFYPPGEALNLYLDGDKSQIVDIDNPDFSQFPKFRNASAFEAFLDEGDIVFIPALWFHNVTALEYSISVNIFWKNLDPALYDKKDPYGNKDLIPAQLGYRTLEKIVSQLTILPQEYQDFYIRRMINRLERRLQEVKVSDTKEVQQDRDF